MVRTGCLLTLQVYLGKQVAECNYELPALELLIEIELEDGSRDSLLRALDYRQECCKREQANLDKELKFIESGAADLGRAMGEKWELERIEVKPLRCV